jgi:hypothetical protein
LGFQGKIGGYILIQFIRARSLRIACNKHHSCVAYTDKMQAICQSLHATWQDHLGAQTTPLPAHLLEPNTVHGPSLACCQVTPNTVYKNRCSRVYHVLAAEAATRQCCYCVILLATHGIPMQTNAVARTSKAAEPTAAGFLCACDNSPASAALSSLMRSVHTPTALSAFPAVRAGPTCAAAAQACAVAGTPARTALSSQRSLATFSSYAWLPGRHSLVLPMKPSAPSTLHTAHHRKAAPAVSMHQPPV